MMLGGVPSISSTLRDPNGNRFKLFLFKEKIVEKLQNFFDVLYAEISAFR